MTTAIKLAIAAGLAILVLLVVGKCRDSNATVANAVAKERVRVADSVTKVRDIEKNAFLAVIKNLSDSVEVRIVNVGELTNRPRPKADTVWLPSPTPGGAPVPAVPLPQYTALETQHNELRAECTLLARDCKALKDSVPKLNALWSEAVTARDKASAARDSVIKHPPPPRRWSLCAAGGYGGIYSGVDNRGYFGPSATLGVCYRIF